MKNGLIFGIIAYSLWGFFPLYWRLLKSVPATEILVHRILWSLAFLAILLAFSHGWSWVRLVTRQRRLLGSLLISAALIGCNWFIYVWAINAGYVVETSLGYFINPLVNVVLGVMLLKEHMRPGQWVAVGIAASGVLYLTLTYGRLPWIALALAFTFGFYGLLKKKVPLNGVQSQSAEMSLLALPALAFLLFWMVNGQASFGQASLGIHLILIAGGPVTAIPLLFFASAARRIPLSTLGLLQYIAPTFQFLIGVYVFREPFTAQRLLGFSIIWIALAVYTFEGFNFRRSLTFQQSIHPITE